MINSLNQACQQTQPAGREFNMLTLNDRPDFQWIVEICYHLIDFRISDTCLFFNCFLLLLILNRSEVGSLQTWAK